MADIEGASITRLVPNTAAVVECANACFQNDGKSHLHLAHQAVAREGVSELEQILGDKQVSADGQMFVGLCCHPHRPKDCPVQAVCLPYAKQQLG